LEMVKSFKKVFKSLFSILSNAAIVTLAIIVSPAQGYLQTIPLHPLAPPPLRHHLPRPDFVGPQVMSRPVEPAENFLAAPSAASGTWTVVANMPVGSFWPNGAFLLTDGRVLVQDGNLTNVAWWTLTPDNSGSYVNGTWNQVASPRNCP